jgi:ADP-ribose pyrophosphatase
MKLLKATIKGKTTLSTGFLTVNRYQIEADKHAGGTHEITWEMMERGNAVAVLGYDPVHDVVVLINELRPGLLIAGDYPFTDNLVAGGMNAGESPIEAAVREMQEEANLVLTDAVLIHPGAYVSSGGSTEKIAIVVGRVDSTKAGGIHGNPNESEDIKTVILPAHEFIERVRRAVITDLKTLVAGYWFAEHRQELRKRVG